MIGSNYDPNNDQQSSADSDLLGNASAAMLQAQLDTTSISGDTIYYYRVRVGSLANANSSSSFYLAIDLNGTGNYPTADMFVEAKYSIIGGNLKKAEINFHKADFSNGNTGFSPSTTAWQASTTDENLEYQLLRGQQGNATSYNNNNAYIGIASTTSDIDVDGNNDYWVTFGFTLSQLNLWAKTGYSSGGTVIAPNNVVNSTVTGSSAVALFAFTSTSQTSNGDIGGINDRTADLTQSWSDLGLVINTTLDNLGAGAPASPTVVALTTADTTPTVTGTAKLPTGDTLAVTVNNVSYTPTLTQVGTTDTYNWAVQVTTPLAAGTYQVVATTSRTSGGSTLTASDLTTNELVVNITLPDQTPTIISYTDDVSAQTGDFGNGSRTNDLAPLLKGVLDAPLDAGDVVRIYRSTNNGSFGTYIGTATVSSTNWTYQDSYPFSQGDGITMGLAAGGTIWGRQSRIPLFGGILSDSDYPSPLLQIFRPWPPSRPPFEIFVNVEGKRFVREDIPSHDTIEQALLQQTGTVCWILFDDAMFKAAPPIMKPELWSREEYAALFNAQSFFHRADSLGALARLAGIDPEGLAATVATYNAGQASARDSFGRQHMPLPIAKGPFYAIKLHSWKYTNYAGLAVDGQLRVTDSKGAPIPGLYAAGEIIGNGTTMGRSVCGGMSVTPALTFGRLLGQRLLPI